MKKSISILLSATLLVFLNFNLAACSKTADETTTDTSTTDDSGGTTVGGGTTASPTPVPDTTLSDLSGYWISGCDSTSNINSASAWVKKQIHFAFDGSANFMITYYPSSACSGTSLMYIYTQGTMTVDSTTTSPANGHLLKFAVSGYVTLGTTSSTAGRDHLTNNCGHGTFNLNGGVNVSSSGFTCTSDSRFTITGASHTADLVVVNNTTTIDMTSMFENLPGILDGGTVDTSTSITYTKN